VAVDLGPGMFTGLRVGVAAGKALSHARRLPMIGVTSLDLLAFPLRHSPRRIVCALDAGRGEIFHASYRQSPGGVQRITSPQVATPDDLASDLLATGDEVLLAGDGALRYATTFDAVRRVELADRGEAYPQAGSLVQLAHARALREEFVSPAELTPTYLRKPDAEINWTTRDEAAR
jgi:tRNA threonylcarbamoyladenosine biosynthesis protein TsaB